MSKLAPLLDDYDISHTHPTNITIHWIAEPSAIFALMALANSIQLPIGTLLWPFLALMLGYFYRLSPRATLAFLPVVALFVSLITVLNRALTLQAWIWAAPLFVICWLTLLMGHKIEGHVPSVFKNPNLIFVGPAWLMRRIFRRLGLRDP